MDTSTAPRSLSRRNFLKSTVAGAAGIGAMSFLPARSWAQVRGANDVVRVGVAGLRGKGRGTIRSFHELPGARVTALCDVDTQFLDREKALFTERGEKVETYVDFRKMLESPNVDVVAIATPNHWHSLQAIWACQAGKDVYVEKPVSHNVWEGRQLVRAARKYNRIMQAGTQNRSDVGLLEAAAFVLEGNIGQVKVARGFCYKRRDTIGRVTGPQTPPATVDYDMWIGPAEMKPLLRESLHYDWHWVWNTGNGDLGNQGIHEVDLCHWFLDVQGLPSRVVSVGGRFGYIDDGETANTQVILYDYAKAPIIFEVRGLPMNSERGDAMDNYRGIRVGIVIECEGGYFAGGRNGGWIYDNDGRRVRQFQGDGGGGHYQNFIDAVHSRRRENLHADVEQCHVTSALCHLGNISHRLGTGRRSAEIRERIALRSDLLEAYGRMEDHLAANQVNIGTHLPIIGPVLEIDPMAERFRGPYSGEANSMLSRAYRKGYEVTSEV